MAGIDSAGKPRTQFLVQMQHRIASAQLEDVDGVLVFDPADDRHVRRDFANRVIFVFTVSVLFANTRRACDTRSF